MTSLDVSAEDGEEKATGLKEPAPESVEVSGQKSVPLLSDEELNVKVAELCGWETYHGDQTIEYQWEPGHINEVKPAFCRSGEFAMQLPDYCHDLNAMHEAEKIILERSDGVTPPDLWDNYYANLQQGHSIIIHADARRRAEAFVITMQDGSEKV